MITIVIPLFNSETYISRAITSCLQQKNVSQIIVIDDASTDLSTEKLEKFISEEPSIEILLLKNKINSGPGFSRNKGIEKAKGKYISFLDADDYYLKNRFKEALALFQSKNDIDGVYNPMIQNFEIDPSTNELIEDYSLNKNFGSKISFEDVLLRSKGTVSHCGILFKRSFIEKHKIRYGEGYWGEDTEMLFKSLQLGNIVYAKSAKSIRSVTGQNISLTLDVNDQYEFHKRCFNEMLIRNYSADVNYYFLKNYVRKHPVFHKRNEPIYRLPKFFFLVFKILITPKLWRKLLK